MRRLLKTGAVSVVLLTLSQVVPVSLSAGIFCNHGLFGCRACNPCRSCRVNPCRCQTPLPPQPQSQQNKPVLLARDLLGVRGRGRGRGRG